MKSVDPGILNHSECFSFQPSEVAARTMKYLTWCGHYFCTSSYFMERETYPYVLVIFVRDGHMDVRYCGKNYLIGKGDVLLIDCVTLTTTARMTAWNFCTCTSTAFVRTRSPS